MKAKRLLTLLEGLCKADPEANVTFGITISKVDTLAKAQLGGVAEALRYLDIEAIYTPFGPPGGEEPEKPEDSFMDIIMDLNYADGMAKEVTEEGEKEFNRLYKKVAE